MMIEIAAFYDAFLALIGIAYIQINKKLLSAFLLLNSIDSTVKLIKCCFVHLHRYPTPRFRGIPGSYRK